MENKSGQGDSVNHPNHYTQGGIECIDAIEAATADMPSIVSPHIANVFKYCWRWHHKGGIESLRKARWYLDRAIERLAKEGDA
ncbi:MAG: DUF3310 domain-containing protein [Spongiibacteraceae bacterium]